MASYSTNPSFQNPDSSIGGAEAYAYPSYLAGAPALHRPEACRRVLELIDQACLERLRYRKIICIDGWSTLIRQTPPSRTPTAALVVPKHMHTQATLLGHPRHRQLLAVRRGAHAPMLHISGAIGRALVLVMRGHVCDPISPGVHDPDRSARLIYPRRRIFALYPIH
jgi:hypothetical protein